MNTKAVRAILGLVADAESVGSVENYHAELLAAMAAVFPCDVVVFNEFRLAPQQQARISPTVTCSASPPIQPAGAITDDLLAAFATCRSTR